MEPKIILLSFTGSPLYTLKLIWELSRSKIPLEQLVPETTNVENFFSRIVREDIPIAEMVDFVFLLDGVSISLREQLVRHRIGVKIGPQLGVDQVPDLADSSFWSQSMRILDMGQFATKGDYIVPESIGENPVAKAIYEQHMKDTEAAYRSLAGLNIPLEDARQVIPLGTTHRLIWKLNLAALKKIVGKRACWILQLGLWKPIIMGMINELCEKVSPVFRELVTPPCYHNGEFKGCLFCENNRARIKGDEDEIPPCPLFVLKNIGVFDWMQPKKTNKWTASTTNKQVYLQTTDRKAGVRFLRMCEEYSKFWGNKYFSYFELAEEPQTREMFFELK